MAATAASLLVRIGADARGLDRVLSGSAQKISKFGTQMNTLGKSLSTSLTLPLGLAATASFKFASDFDDAMTKSLSIMGDVSTAMRDDMASAAVEMSKASRFSATEAGEAYFFLASAGLDAEQSLESLDEVVAFATAGTFDLATATDLLTDAQSALALTSEDALQNMEGMVRVSDVLVKANTLANASVQQFSEALTNQAGAALRNVGKDIEEGVAVLAAYADQGIKGAEAGTKLHQVLRDLQKAAFNNAAAFKRYNIEVFDSNGEMRNLADIVGDMETAFSGMSDEQRRAAFEMLGITDKSISATQSLIGLSDKIRNYEKELRSAGGTTGAVAEKQLQSLGAQFDIMTSFVAAAAIEVGEALAPAFLELFELIKAGADILVGFVETFTELPTWIQATVITAGAFLALLGPLAIGIGLAAKAVAVLTAAVTALKVSIGILAPALIALSAAFMIGSAIAEYTSRVREAKRATEELAEAQRSTTRELTEFERRAARADLGNLVDHMVATGKISRAMAEDLKRSGIDYVESTQNVGEAARRLFQTIGSGATQLGAFIGQLNEADGAMLAAAESQRTWMDELDRSRLMAGLLGEEQLLLSEQYRQTRDAIIDYADILRDSGATQDEINEKTETMRTRLADLEQALILQQSAWGVWAEEMKIAMDGAAGTLAVFSDLTHGTFQEFSAGFGSAMASVLVEGKSFSKTMDRLWRQLAASVISQLISIGVQMVAFSILNAVVGKKLAASSISSSAGRGFAGAYASVLETVPFPANIILAPIVAAGAVAGLTAGAFGQLLAFREGGISLGTGIAMLHPNEVIFPIEKADKMLGLGKGAVNLVAVLDGRVLAQSMIENSHDQITVHFGNTM